MHTVDQKARRRRGRPKGSGIDDEAYLHAVAVRVLAEPSKPLRTLIRAVVDQDILSTPEGARNAQPDSIIHRLAQKWRIDGEALLEAVRVEHREQQLKVIVEGAVAFQHCIEDLSVRAAPLLQVASETFETALRKPEVQQALAWMAKVQAVHRDPRVAKWMTSPLGGSVG